MASRPRRFDQPPISDRYVVPTNHLAATISPLLDRLEEGYECSPTNFIQDAGPFGSLYAHMARHTGIEEKSVPRRIYSIRRSQSYTTMLDIADALLLGLDTWIEHTDLPVLPANPKTARTMVDTHFPRMPEAERRKLARSLHRFSIAYIHESADPYTHKYLAEQNEKKRNRQEKSEGELVAA